MIELQFTLDSLIQLCVALGAVCAFILMLLKLRAQVRRMKRQERVLHKTTSNVKKIADALDDVEIDDPSDVEDP